MLNTSIDEINTSETNTENIFREYYGAKTFIEKSAIPSKYGFKSKDKNSNRKGYPDFFKDCNDFVIIVETKPDNIKLAEDDVISYLTDNKITRPMVGMAVAGQTENDLKVTYYYKTKEIDVVKFDFYDCLLPIEEIEQKLIHAIYGDALSDEELTTLLTGFNNKFHTYGIRDTDRSLFFSGLLIALTNGNFRMTYRHIMEPTNEERASVHHVVLDAHHMNNAIMNAITQQLQGKINNMSKEFSWADRFAFIKTIDMPLEEYKTILKDIENKIYIPFQQKEKQDILGKAYKIFLKRAGKAENKNIILTPDHIKTLMVKLARLQSDDVVLDTCTGSGGFLMEAMEVLIKLCHGDPQKINNVKEKQLIGFEIDPILFSLACSNMFLHGDGRTNMMFRSSLLTDSKQDKHLLDYIRSLHPRKIIINPPYEGNNPILFTKQALEFLEPNGKLITIMPSVTLSDNADKPIMKEILGMAKLDFVIKMPVSIFKEQKRTVYTSIFGFTKTKHQDLDEVLFCDLKDDGLVSVQKVGRIDKKGVWPNIEKQILNAVFNGKEIDGFSEKRPVIKNNKFVFYGVKKNITSKYQLVRFGDIFDTSDKGSIQSEDCNPDGEYDFIAAGKEWKKHDEYTHDGEFIVYVCDSEGSYGRAHYVNGKFIASNLCRILHAKQPDKYPIDMEFYSYYLAAIREKIISDIAIGTSKLTLRQPILDDYIIEYIPYDEQLRLKAIIKAREADLRKAEEIYKAKANAMLADISDM